MGSKADLLVFPRDDVGEWVTQRKGSEPMIPTLILAMVSCAVGFLLVTLVAGFAHDIEGEIENGRVGKAHPQGPTAVASHRSESFHGTVLMQRALTADVTRRESQIRAKYVPEFRHIYDDVVETGHQLHFATPYLDAHRPYVDVQGRGREWSAAAEVGERRWTGKSDCTSR